MTSHPLTSPNLAFTRDGRRLLVLDDAVAIVDVACGTTARIALAYPHAAVGFADQVWVAHGHDVQLARLACDGRGIDARVLPGDGTLVAAAVGAPAAVWGTSALFDDGGILRTAAVPAADLVLPLTARRWVTVAGARVVAPSGLSCELPAGTRILGGAIILDGTAVALLAERAGVRELVVVGLANGRVQLRQAVRAGDAAPARIAARRGLLGLQVGPRAIAIIDLRSARALGELAAPFDVADFALDPDGERLALRDGATAIELVGVRAALAPKPTVAGAAPDAHGRGADASRIDAGDGDARGAGAREANERGADASRVEARGIAARVADEHAADMRGADARDASGRGADASRTTAGAGAARDGDAGGARERDANGHGADASRTTAGAGAARDGDAGGARARDASGHTTAGEGDARDGDTRDARARDANGHGADARRTTAGAGAARDGDAGGARARDANGHGAGAHRGIAARVADEHAAGVRGADARDANGRGANAGRVDAWGARRADAGDVDGRGFDPGAHAGAVQACGRTLVLAARPFDLRALAPVEQVTPVPRDAALALLDREVRTVALWTLRAIAEAWNTRRLGFGNEGQHPFEHEVAALLGMNRGFAADYVDAAETWLAAHAVELAACGHGRGAEAPLGALAAELELSPLAIDILMVVAAPALWSEAARLYGILANDPARPLVDEALVEQVLGARVSRHAIAAELDPRAPLVRTGAIAIEGRRARPFAALAVDPVVLARLRRELPDLGVGVTTRGSDRALEELVVAPAVIDDALVALARATGAARIVVRGRPGSGRRTLLAALAAEANRALGVIDATLLPRGDRQLAAVLRLALQRVQLAGLLPCIVALEDAGHAEAHAREALAEVLRAHPGPLAVVLPATEAAPIDPGHVAIDLPVLDESARLGVWETALADAGVAADAVRLASRYRLGPGAIHRALRGAVERGRAGDRTGEIERFIRQARDARLGQHARRVERLATWDGLVLPPDILDSLRELVGRVRHRRTVFETWGMDRAMATSRGLTALFSGPPGTGKTLVAGVIARELGLDLYQIDLSKLMSKWIGETERNLAAIFDAAEDGQVILLFDEADSLFAKRTEIRSSNDRYANLEVNYLLQRLDTFEGIAILTTNASSSIDPAFKRRLSFRLSFPFPDEETREQLWRVHLPPELPVAGPLALDRLAHKYQLSGGYIRNACLRAAFLAAQDETPVTQYHLDRAVTLEYAELGKLSTSGTID